VSALAGAVSGYAAGSTVSGMECQFNDVSINYVEHGSGVPLIGLHGAGVDHREIEAAIEAIVPLDGYRRIYPDLPGMGRTTTGTNTLNCNDDVATLMTAFIDHVVDGPFLLLGHSYGGYLARGIVARKPESVLGLALLCPIGEHSRDVPEQTALRVDAEAYNELEPNQRAGFDDYFVIRTPATAIRYRECVVPGNELVDDGALERIFAGWGISVGSNAFTAPSLIAAGRFDSAVGYVSAADLLGYYPRATFAVLDRAGHALPHEQPAVLKALLHDWLARSTQGD
jgi:pimeloyl-ACP methyl ester carboxylesterase